MENKDKLFSLATLSRNIPGQTQIELRNPTVAAASNPDKKAIRLHDSSESSCAMFVDIL